MSHNRKEQTSRWLELGHDHLDQGQYEQAIQCFQKAARLNPDDANIYFFIGATQQRLSSFDQALETYQKVLALDSRHVEALYNTAVAFHSLGRLKQAISRYQKVIELKPEFVDPHFNLGSAFHDLKKYPEAIACYRNALKLNPGYYQADYNLGNIYKELGEPSKSLECYQNALKIKPDLAQAFNNMGVIHKDMKMIDQAMECYQAALDINPRFVEALYNMGIALQVQGKYREGLTYFKTAGEIDPGYQPARWLYLLSLPMYYDNRDEIHYYRKRFEKNLDLLIREIKLDTPEKLKPPLDGIGSTTNFFLQYQGKSDLLFQKKYGEMVHRIMTVNYPEWSQPRSMPLPDGNGKIRLGFVSSFMNAHTIGLFLLGWLQGLNKNLFEIYGYHIGDTLDSLTETIQSHCTRFTHTRADLEATARNIISDDLHVLTFTDIGMNAPATLLASLRLAPVQCKGWGHPVTTGLPTIDYYLSSDLMEPANAQESYSEKLVRLPNLALFYQKPDTPPIRSRNELGLRDDSFIYLSSQSLFKYLPQYDHIYPEIASLVPGCRFVFISHTSEYLTRLFQKRFARAFEEQGLKMEDHCVFVPRLDFKDFLSLNIASDVLLDTPGWSGGKTTLEAISCGLPVVTHPGSLMRGRHAFAMLEQMGVQETIAGNLDEYVEIAVKLGLNRDFYQAVAQKIKTGMDKLYQDRDFITGLEQFYQRVVNERSTTDFNDNHAHKALDAFEASQNGQPIDAKRFYAEGQSREQSGAWNEAIINYQKALACIPNFLGIRPWFQNYLLDPHHPKPYGRGFLSEVYGSLAKCLYRTGAYESSLLAAEASLDFNPDNIVGQSMLNSVRTGKAPIVEAPSKIVGKPHTEAKQFLEEKLSILIVTSYTHKLKKNRHLAPPGTGLLETTYQSLRDVFGEALDGCKKHLCYDRNNRNLDKEIEYQENLQVFRRQYNFELHVMDRRGLQDIMIQMVRRIKTPYLFFLEHDWKFLPPFIEMKTLLEVFENCDHVHYVRFNKRKNKISNFDFLMETESHANGVHLVRTPAHSNNPFIARMAKLRDEWLPLCQNDPFCQKIDLRGTAFGFENPLFKSHMADIRRDGFLEAHKKWGTYVYGKPGDSARIEHLGE